MLYSYPAIETSENAIQYFPKLATEILTRAVADCHADYECVHSTIHKRHAFDADGVLAGDIKLRVVRGGKFVDYNGDSASISIGPKYKSAPIL